MSLVVIDNLSFQKLFMLAIRPKVSTWKKRREVTIALVVGMATFFAQNQAEAAGDAAYKSAMAAYTKKDYQTASKGFQLSITQGNNTPLALLYLGYAYFGCGDKQHCLKAYCDLADNFPSTREGQQAAQLICRLAPNLARKYGALVPLSAPATQVGTKSTANAATVADPSLAFDTIIVTKPQFSHPKVSQHTVDIVKTAIRRLKPSIYKMLRDSGATVTVAGNTSDRWPNNTDIEKPMDGSDDVFGEAAGVTYHRDHTGPDIGIYERRMVRGTKLLQEPFSDEIILHSAFHELAHGVDDIIKMSLNPAFLSIFHSEAAALSEENRTINRYYLKPMECCAEITSGLIGGDQSCAETALVMRCFPRTAQWIKSRLPN